MKLFSYTKEQKFKTEMIAIQKRLGGTHPNEKYKSLLEWRHAYAHSKRPLTTIEEAHTHYKYSKFIIYAFNKAIK